MKIEFSSICDQGPVREENQDRYLVSDFTTTVGGRPAEGVRVPGGERGILMAVADGMGGHAGGAQAAQMALATLIAHLKSAPVGADPVERLTKAIEMANTAVLQTALADPMLAGMGTTLTAVWIKGKSLYIGHVGDTRAYLLRRGELKSLTSDHSMLTKLMGIDEDEARKRVGGNVLVQCVGGRADDILVETARVSLCRGDRILLSSDGLHGVMDRAEIRRLLSNVDLTQCVQHLLQAALKNGTTDNVTVILADVKDEALPESRWDAPAKLERVTEIYFDKRAGQIKKRKL